MTVNDLLCFGERDGRLRFDTVIALEAAGYRALDISDVELWALCGDSRPVRAIRRWVRFWRDGIDAVDNKPLARMLLRVGKQIGRQMLAARG